MKCLIVDDEHIACEGLSEYVEQTQFLTLAGTCGNAFEAIEFLANYSIDLLFLDINMPLLTGLDMLKSLPNPPMVIFTTAYTEHALEGFELNAVDYLAKPIMYSRFLKACQKAYELFNLRNQSAKNEETTTSDFIYIKVDKKLVKVNFDDILYIESLKDYIQIHTKRQQCLITYLNLKKIKELLPKLAFLQIHKSYIISIRDIKATYGNMVELVTGKELPIGQRYRKLLYEKIIRNNLVVKQKKS